MDATQTGVAVEQGQAAAADERWFKPEPAYLRARLLGETAWLSLLAVILAGSFQLSGASPAAVFAGAAAPLAILAAAVIYGRLLVRRMAYRLAEEALLFRTGVIWVSETIIPYRRIQHLAHRQGPVERMFELHTLLVYTAGTAAAGAARADCAIPGLSAEALDRLEKALLAAISTDRAGEDTGDAGPQPR